MNGLRWKIDKRKLATHRVREAAADGLGQFAEAVLTQSNQVVPIEEGTLERSGGTDLDREALRAAVTYDTPYAVRQHEDTRLRHDEGREAKYLENTIKTMAPKMGPFLAERIRRAAK